MQKLEQGTNLVQAAVRIQHFFCNWYYSRQLHRYSCLLKPRKQLEYSSSYADRIQHYLQHPQYQYTNPGIDKHSVAYTQMLSTPVVVCGVDMLPSDYMLLGSILKHPQSNIHTILLHNTSFVYNINEDIITHYTECVRKNITVHYNPLGQEYTPTEKSMIYFFYSLMKSISLRSIHIVAGRYHPNILRQLFKMIQLDNARIEEVVIHAASMYRAPSVSNHTLSHVLVSSATQLLMDYFNYSLQGIKRLCLHNVGIGDGDIDILCDGLKINPSLQSLHLSRNLITDQGFLCLFTTLLGFSNTRLHYIDLSCNLIAFQAKTIRPLLTDYRKDKHPALMSKNITLVLNLCQNLILHRIDVVDLSVDQHILPQLEVLYDDEHTHDSNNKSMSKMKGGVATRSRGTGRGGLRSSEDAGEIDKVLMHKMRKMHRLPIISSTAASHTRSALQTGNVSLPVIKGAKGGGGGRLLLSKSLNSF
ncbi:hypothetical protein EON65_29200 [archaeon]|nr:MAG: hypothetical protein EON65_29200 [archaeon]